MQQNKIAVVGEYSTILVYKTFGWEIVPVTQKDNVVEIISKMITSKQYRAIFVTKKIYDLYIETKGVLSQELIQNDVSLIPLVDIDEIKNLPQKIRISKYKELARIATSIKLD